MKVPKRDESFYEAAKELALSRGLKPEQAENCARAFTFLTSRYLPKVEKRPKIILSPNMGIPRLVIHIHGASMELAQRTLEHYIEDYNVKYPGWEIKTEKTGLRPGYTSYICEPSIIEKKAQAQRKAKEKLKVSKDTFTKGVARLSAQEQQELLEQLMRKNHI